MVDFFLVLMLSGAGDELQGIKKGVLELADAIAINKADGNNIEKTEEARREYEAAMGLLYHPSPVWTPPVLTCSALTLDGLEKIWEIIEDHRAKLTASGELADNRRRQALDWMWSLVEDGLKDNFYGNADVQKLLPRITDKVEKGMTTPTTAAVELLELLQKP
jgi:LAO/AO transport system kinase